MIICPKLNFFVEAGPEYYAVSRHCTVVHFAYHKNFSLDLQSQKTQLRFRIHYFHNKVQTVPAPCKFAIRLFLVNFDELVYPSGRLYVWSYLMTYLQIQEWTLCFIAAVRQGTCSSTRPTCKRLTLMKADSNVCWYALRFMQLKGMIKTIAVWTSLNSIYADVQWFGK